MEYLFNILRRLKSHIMDISVEGERYNKIDEFFDVLSWKYPIASLSVFLTTNYVLWMMIDSNVQLLGAIFMICLKFFIIGNVMSLLLIESPNPVEYVECCEKISKTLSKVSRYRKENPLEFCFMMSMFFLMLAYISSIFSGEVICFFILWSAFLSPLIYKHSPPVFKRKLEGVLSYLEKFHEVIGEEDLIPLAMENSPDDNEDLESLGADRTADSVTNSLISGISSMPSFLDAEDNREILEEDLIPINHQCHELTPSFGDSSDSDSELKEINLKESHFIRESSSDEEEKFEEGLRFEETQNHTVDESKGLVHDIVDYVTSTGAFQLSNMINNARSSMQSTETKNISSRNSTSDEDFEIIDLEDLKK